MRTTSSVLLFVVSLVFVPKLAIAGNATDMEMLAKADAIVAKAKGAGLDELARLADELDPIVAAKGLSQPCHKILDGMQSVLRIESYKETYAGMTDDVKKAIRDARDVGMAEDRKACIDAK